MKKIRDFFEFIFSFLVMYNSVALQVCKNFFQMIPLIIVTPIAVFIIYVVGWHISFLKKLNYELKD